MIALWCVAFVEIAIGAGVLAHATTSLHQMLGMTLLGCGSVALVFAGLISEVRMVRREMAEEERQGRVAAALKHRSLMISSIDRQQRQSKRPKRTRRSSVLFSEVF